MTTEHSNDLTPLRASPPEAGVTGRLIRITTALAVAAVAAVAAVISYRHAYELVTSHGETGLTARLLPFTVDGLILAASMLILDGAATPHPGPSPSARPHGRCSAAETAWMLFGEFAITRGRAYWASRGTRRRALS